MPDVELTKFKPRVGKWLVISRLSAGVIHHQEKTAAKKPRYNTSYVLLLYGRPLKKAHRDQRTTGKLARSNEWKDGEKAISSDPSLSILQVTTS